MSLRRTRIKATANLLTVKRKPRSKGEPLQVLATKEIPVVVLDASPPEEKEEEEQQLPIEESVAAEIQHDAVAFKMPAASAGQLQDDVCHSDLDDNVIQMDLQKTANGYPMSPTKAQARQRVRPMPSFGQQRRNSFVGSPLAGEADGLIDYPSPGTPNRRERYLSGSSTSGTPQQQLQQQSPLAQSPHKYFSPVMSPGVGRIRTESSCSTYSDVCSPGGKPRGKESGDKAQQSQRVNHRRDFETRFNSGVPDKSTFKMFDMIYYNPSSNPMEQKPAVTTIKAETETKPETPEQLLEAKMEPAAALPVPQLKLDANGEMIIDEKTLEIETTAEVEARKVLANSSLILMDETTGNNGFYKRHRRTRGWNAEETVRFYRSLQIIGTDFSLMCQMFPLRSRRDLKLKYKKEERTNGQLINKALLYPKAFNIQELKDQLDMEDRERAEAEQQWREVVAAEAAMTQKRPKSQVSKAARTLSDGNLIYENEHVTKQKMGKHAFAKRRANLAQASDENTTTSTESNRKRPRRTAPVEEAAPSHSQAIKKEVPIKTEQALGPQLLEQEELNALLDDDEVELDEVEEVAALPNKSIINMDDGTLNYVSDVEAEFIEIETSPIVEKLAEPVTPASEHDIEQILMELAEGSLVLVSSLDTEHEERVINEIYMYDKNTGDLCDHPLNIPEHIVQCILNVMS